MLSFPTVVNEIKIKWCPKPGIYRINIQTFGQKHGFQVQSLPDRLAKTIKNIVNYLEQGQMYLPLDVRKLP